MEFLKNVKSEITLLGYKKKKDWECFEFNININGQNFEYNVGIGHSKDISTYNEGFVSPKKIKELKDQGYTIRATRDITVKNIVNHVKTAKIEVLVKSPKIEDVLNCLFLDSQAQEQCFEDWANDFGYDSDSISAKNTYQDCVNNAFKLKKALGKDFYSIKDEIEKLEL